MGPPLGTAPILMMALALVGALLLGVVIGRLNRPGDPPSARIPVPEPALEPAPPAPNRIDIEALAEPVLIVAGGSVVAANAAARLQFGDRVGGRDVALTLRHPVLLDSLAEAMRHGILVEREIAALGTGNRAWRLRVVPDGSGRVLMLFDDITQARLTERMRVDFVANASHELRTPLATLSGFIETLQGPAAEDEPARRRFLDIMALEADRMRRLIDDLLSLSRIELDKYIRPAATVDLAPLIGEVGHTLAVRLEADRRALRIDTAPGLPPVTADRDQILQVLHNLVSNALKYGQPGTPITISAAPEAGRAGAPAMVRVTVADQGEGIAPEHLPRLTERFYRVDSQRSRQLGGTGLGLAIVKHIVERHRGRLEIDSRPGEGTRVGFTLPVAAAAPAVTEVQ